MLFAMFESAAELSACWPAPACRTADFVARQPRFGDGGDVGRHRRALAAGHADRAELAVAHLGERAEDARHHEVDVSRHDLEQGRTLPAVGHMHDLHASHVERDSMDRCWLEPALADAKLS